MKYSLTSAMNYLTHQVLTRSHPANPEVGSVMPSSGLKTGGVMLTEVASVVAQLMVVVCPELTEVGLTVNDVICG